MLGGLNYALPARQVLFLTVENFSVEVERLVDEFIRQVRRSIGNQVPREILLPIIQGRAGQLGIDHFEEFWLSDIDF